MSEQILEYHVRGGYFVRVEGQVGPEKLTIPKAMQKELRHLRRVLVTVRDGAPISWQRAPQPTLAAAPAADPPDVLTPPPPVARHAPRPRRPLTPAFEPNGSFVNPYNFVPLSAAMRQVDGLGEGPGDKLDHAHAGRYSAKLAVNLTTVTPLLALEVSSKRKNQPAVYTVKRDAAGRPVMQGASIKGMLRALYEQVTGSRLGVFNHSDPWSVRAESEVALELTMVKVETHEADQQTLRFAKHLVPQPTTRITKTLNPLVSIPRDGLGGRTFGKAVHVWLELQDFGRYLAWVQIAPLTDAASETPGTSWGGQGSPVLGEPLVQVKGTLHATGRTFQGKKAERLFVDEVVGETLDPGTITVPREQYARVLRDWRLKLDEYSDEPTIAGTRQRPVTLDKADYVVRRATWQRLERGQTLYCRGRDRQLQLYPALITREMYPASPSELLGEALAPASDAAKLTAAERLFGWVAPDAGSPEKAVRGRLRVGGVLCNTSGKRPRDDAARWTLATLNSPKPSHARFYTRDTDGNPLDGMARGEGFKADEHTLAGHKVYPHHQRPKYYWDLPPGGWQADGPDHPKDTDGKWLDYLAARSTPGDVSLAIQDWIEPGTTFSTTLYVQDVTKSELVALLWVLALSDAAKGLYLKLGQGKPLGFGSITMAVDWTHSVVLDHGATLSRYRSPDTAPADEFDHVREVEAFDKELRTRAPGVYQSIIAAARGTAQPVHYPRLGQDSWLEPQLETYEWFVRNERGHFETRIDGQDRVKDTWTGLRRALPLLSGLGPETGGSLPTDPRSRQKTTTRKGRYGVS